MRKELTYGCQATPINPLRKHQAIQSPGSAVHLPVTRGGSATPGAIRYINPDSLYRAVNAYTQVVVSEGAVRTVYVSGQNALDDHGRLIGKGDLRAQMQQAYRNLQSALESAGARLEHIVKWNLYLIEGQSLGPGFGEFAKAWRGPPPAMTILFVAALAHSDYLVEMDAIAAVPLDTSDSDS